MKKIIFCTVVFAFVGASISLLLARSALQGPEASAVYAQMPTERRYVVKIPGYDNVTVSLSTQQSPEEAQESIRKQVAEQLGVDPKQVTSIAIGGMILRGGMAARNTEFKDAGERWMAYADKLGGFVANIEEKASGSN